MPQTRWRLRERPSSWPSRLRLDCWNVNRLTRVRVIQALLEVVQSGGKNLEICVMTGGQKSRMLELPEIEKIVAEVEKEKEEEAAQKKKEKQSEKK